MELNLYYITNININELKMKIKKALKKKLHKDKKEIYCPFYKNKCIKEECLLYSKLKQKCLNKIL